MTGTPVIEEVTQVDLPPVRPGRGWYAAGVAVIVGGLVAAFLLLTSGAFGYLRDIDGLVRVDAPGEATVALPEGTVVVYHEPAGGPVLVPAGDALEIRGPSGEALAWGPPDDDDRYAVEGRRGWAVAQVHVPEAGDHEVVVRGGFTGRLALGRSPTDRLTVLGAAALVVAVLAVLVGAAVAVVTWRRRARAQAERLRLQRARPPVTRLS